MMDALAACREQRSSDFSFNVYNEMERRRIEGVTARTDLFIFFLARQKTSRID